MVSELVELMKGLIHGNRNKVSARRLDKKIYEKVVNLAKGEYEGYENVANIRKTSFVRVFTKKIP